MKTQSAKAKGRNLQTGLRDAMVKILGVSAEDISSRSMGSGGEDLIIGVETRKVFILYER